MYKETILEQAIYPALQELQENSTRSLDLKLSPDTRLFGADGQLDSIALVGFLISVEENLEENLQTTITLATDKAMSQKNSPFRSVNDLAEYILTLVRE